MAIAYEAAITSAAAATAAPYVELKSNATRRAKVREVGMFSTSATAASKTQLMRPGTVGTQTTTVTGFPQDPADATGVTLLSATWSTAPLVGTTILRQWDFNNVIGSGVIFTWPSDGELVIPIVAPVSIVIWNGGGAGGPASDVYFVWSE
jgi:hypothetical protein